MSDASPTSSTTARDRDAIRRRRRLWLVLAGVSVGWKLLVFTLGAAIPRWLLDDGIARLPERDRDYASRAKVTAMALWNGPIERHGLVRGVRVVSVGSGGAREGASCGGRVALVRAYTYFAIPYSEVRTSCDRGVVEYRVFRRRATDGASGAP